MRVIQRESGPFAPARRRSILGESRRFDWGLIGPNCTALQSSPFEGDTSAAEIVPPNPVLDVRGLPQAGGTIRFTIEGPVGALARAWLGRNATRRIDADVQIEELTERSLTLELGVLPASGSISFDYRVPAT